MKKYVNTEVKIKSYDIMKNSSLTISTNEGLNKYIFFVSVPFRYIFDKWDEFPRTKRANDLLSEIFKVDIKFLMIGDNGNIFRIKVNTEEEATHFLLKYELDSLTKQDLYQVERFYRKHKSDTYHDY